MDITVSFYSQKNIYHFGCTKDGYFSFITWISYKHLFISSHFYAKSNVPPGSTHMAEWNWTGLKLQALLKLIYLCSWAEVIFSPSASLHPGELIGTSDLLERSDEILGGSLRWISTPLMSKL